MKKAILILLLAACSDDPIPVVEKDMGMLEDVSEDLPPDVSENKAPFAFDQSLNTFVDKQVDCILDGKDPDGDTITFELLESPENGTLVGDIPNFKYKPNTGFIGKDAFRFRTSDGDLLSEPADVEVSVTAPDGKPVLTILEPTQNIVLGSSLNVKFVATAIDDEDGDISANIKWESNIDGPLGEGAQIEVPLTIGKHIVRADIVDEGDTLVSTSVNVDIIQTFPTKVIGTVGQEKAGGIGVDSMGNVYVAGSTDNSFTGFNQGGRDGFLVKYDKDGNEVWKKSVASSQNDEINQLKIDQNDNIFVVGTTDGSINNGILRGGSDVFIVKYDSAGTIVWSKQFGTNDDDTGQSLHVDDATGEVYVVGSTFGSFYPFISLEDGLDGFLQKFDANGTADWFHQTRSIGKQIYDGVGIGKNLNGDRNVYITGNSSQNRLNEPMLNNQLIVIELTQAGIPVMSRSIGNQEDEFSGGMAEGLDGKLYNGFSSKGFTGSTRGGFDCHIRDITDVGFDYKRVWGGEGDDILTDIVGLDGQLYATGRTDNDFEEGGNVAQTHIGGQDIFISATNTEVGGISWRHIIGNTSDNMGHRIAARDGAVYVLATTEDGFENSIALGGTDLLIVQYDIKGTRF